MCRGVGVGEGRGDGQVGEKDPSLSWFPCFDDKALR